jgi:tetratricopeptide (TPR) repeat protein
MASIIPGYEYDIFISYRQKDNKHDGWVTEFVDNLKGELESTFKEEISVYFDINPHDGLLETHDVDASLKDKLKCLVFIPIISRTYCDIKSFAWEHEFKAFVEQASKDQFGLKVKLPNGNIASRVLPVRIHDLDNADIKLCESLLGGVLRGVDFIYKSAGVNRPLRSEEEKPHENLNHTIYRDQINKVANALKEIISGLRAGEVVSEKEKTESAMPWEEVKKEKRFTGKLIPNNLNRIKLLSRILSIVILIVLAGVFVYPKFFKSDSLKKLRAADGRIPIAIMPFQNMSNDSTLNYLKDWIPESVTSYLSNFSEDFQVRQTESIYSVIKSQGLTNNASIAPSVAAVISQKLDANIFISGSLTKTSSGIIINAKLVNSKTEEILKPFEIAGSFEEINPIIDTLSRKIKDYLIVSKLKKELSPESQSLVSTSSPEALRYFILGQNASRKSDRETAIKEYARAVKIDSNFTAAYLNLLWTYYWMDQTNTIDSTRKLCPRLYNKRDQMPPLLKLRTEHLYSILFGTPYESIKYLTQLLELDDQQPGVYPDLGVIYCNYFHQYEKALSEFEKSYEILKKWGRKPISEDLYTNLGILYNLTKQYRKGRKLLEKAEKEWPDSWGLSYYQAILSLRLADTIAANRYLDKLASIEKEYATPEIWITYGNPAEIYTEAGMIDRAERIYRQCISLEPENPGWWNDLAYLLFDHDRNINEGMKYVDKALELDPDNFKILDTKGWGLYKQGKYKEALDILEKNWNLYRMGDTYSHLEEIKKAIARQK